jgi:glycine/D-amino acid oxidase-like deaminating enzyme
MLVVGDGIIGLSIAVEAARRGAKVTVLGRPQQGAATWASGGLLAPSTGTLPAEAAPFFYASLAAYPEYVGRLSEFEPGLALIQGLIELVDAAPDAGEARPRGEAQHVDRKDLARLEPALPWRRGTLLHPRDGAVNPRMLLTALRSAADLSPRIRFCRELSAEAVDARDDAAAAIASDGTRFNAQQVVLAAGAWTPQVRGLPRAIPVAPLKGQMLALEGSPLQHPVLSDHTYLLPRGRTTLVGSTSDDTGFDVSTDAATLARLAAIAGDVCPALVGQPVIESWAGLRPMTPDRLPIIGRDPDVPGLIYACGHGRNGILLAPATATAIADLLFGALPRNDLHPFAMQRFDGARHRDVAVTVPGTIVGRGPHAQ